MMGQCMMHMPRTIQKRLFLLIKCWKYFVQININSYKGGDQTYNCMNCCWFLSQTTLGWNCLAFIISLYSWQLLVIYLYSCPTTDCITASEYLAQQNLSYFVRLSNHEQQLLQTLICNFTNRQIQMLPYGTPISFDGAPPGPSQPVFTTRWPADNYLPSWRHDKTGVYRDWEKR